MRHRAFGWAILVAMTLWGAAALAEDGSDQVVYKKKTVIDFSDVTIEGELTKPDGSYVVSRKLSRFSTLIQYRQDYKFELLNSHNEL